MKEKLINLLERKKNDILLDISFEDFNKAKDDLNKFSKLLKFSDISNSDNVIDEMKKDILDILSLYSKTSYEVDSLLNEFSDLFGDYLESNKEHSRDNIDDLGKSVDDSDKPEREFNILCSRLSGGKVYYDKSFIYDDTEHIRKLIEDAYKSCNVDKAEQMYSKYYDSLGSTVVSNVNGIDERFMHEDLQYSASMWFDGLKKKNDNTMEDCSNEESSLIDYLIECDDRLIELYDNKDSESTKEINSIQCDIISKCGSVYFTEDEISRIRLTFYVSQILDNVGFI